jgi:hypothetical protein
MSAARDEINLAASTIFPRPRFPTLLHEMHVLAFPFLFFTHFVVSTR